MSSKTYLLYVAGGKCRDTHAARRDEDGEPIKLPLVYKQFWVREELRRMGIDAWCGDRIDFKRLGKHRVAEPRHSPALPNYMFAEIDAEDLFRVLSVDHVSPTFQVLSHEELHGRPAVPENKEAGVRAKPPRIGIMQFKEAAEADYRAAQRVEANKRESVAEYVKGQRLRVISGPFVDMFATFEKMVQAAHDQWPKLTVDVNGYKVAVDPLDVRRA